MQTIAFCESDRYCREVLRKHWPATICYDDVSTLTAERLFQDTRELPDVICGGFPCQDVSLTGYRAGLAGERSGLWKEFARLIREIRPLYALVENTPGLLSLGMDQVLGDLAEIGYDAEWHCLPAALAGARQLRERVFIVATTREMVNATFLPARYVKHASQIGRWETLHRIRSIFDGTSWASEPNVDRVAYGVPDGAHRNSRLGNAVVPAITEMIGRAIMSASL